MPFSSSNLFFIPCFSLHPQSNYGVIIIISASSENVKEKNAREWERIAAAKQQKGRKYVCFQLS